VEAFGVLIKFKMADVAMATKMHFFLNLFQAWQTEILSFKMAAVSLWKLFTD
jgi:hypothetical protein